MKKRTVAGVIILAAISVAVGLSLTLVDGPFDANKVGTTGQWLAMAATVAAVVVALWTHSDTKSTGEQTRRELADDMASSITIGVQQSRRTPSVMTHDAHPSADAEHAIWTISLVNLSGRALPPSAKLTISTALDIYTYDTERHLDSETGFLLGWDELDKSPLVRHVGGMPGVGDSSLIVRGWLPDLETSSEMVDFSLDFRAFGHQIRVQASGDYSVTKG